jgi:hypothetical protein
MLFVVKKFDFRQRRFIRPHKSFVPSRLFGFCMKQFEARRTIPRARVREGARRSQIY